MALSQELTPKALMMMLAAMAVIPASDAFAKHLAGTYPVWQIAWMRFALHAALLAPLVIWHSGWRALWPKQPVLQALRGGLLFADVLCFFSALALLPLADTLAVFFISPLLVTLLAVPLLGERLGPRRLIAVLAGFAGALIIIRPGFAAFNWGYGFALAAGLAYALFMISTRKLATRRRALREDALVTTAHTGIFVALAAAPVMPFIWLTPSPADFLMILAMAGFAAASHYLLVLALEETDAGTLAPFTYFEIVAAVALGYLFFNDFPDPWTWTGIAVITGAGIYNARRQRAAG